jgi:hypothetical protein
MGIFLETVELINRAPVNLTVKFDGQEKTLKPGSNWVPYVTVEFAKNQNPIMGSQDPYNPHISGCSYLVGIAGTKDPVTPLTPEEWETHLGRPCREDEQVLFEDRYGSDPKAKLVTYGKGKRTNARSRNDAGTSPTGNADFSGKV